jgi:hypothetical protein
MNAPYTVEELQQYSLQKTQSDASNAKLRRWGKRITIATGILFTAPIVIYLGILAWEALTTVSATTVIIFLLVLILNKK